MKDSHALEQAEGLLYGSASKADASDQALLWAQIAQARALERIAEAQENTAIILAADFMRGAPRGPVESPLRDKLVARYPILDGDDGLERRENL